VVPAIQKDIDNLLAAYHASGLNGGIGVPGGPTGPVLNITIVGGGAPPTYAGTHPLAGNPLSAADLAAYQQCGNSIGRHVAALVVRAGTHATNGLRAEDLNTDWASLKLSDVGYTQRTVLDMKTKIDTEGAKHAVPKTAEEKRTKLLSLITFPTELASRATNELQYASAHWRVGGLPSYELTAVGMSELWETYWKQGAIKFKAPPLHRAARPTAWTA
jgi:hypothetical protein